MNICIFMALWLRMFVAGANKVEGTMSWCLGTNQILASIKHMVLPKVKQGHFETTMLILHIIFHLLLRVQVFGSITLNIFMIQMLCTVMQLFKGSYFSVDAASGHFWPNSAIANGISVKVHVVYKRSFIFKTLPVKQ